jgi:hypothetical protein
LPSRGERLIDTFVRINHRHDGLFTHREKLHAEPFAKASPAGLSLSVTTMMRVPISGTSAAMKP